MDAEARGDTETAERLIAEPVVVPSVIPVPVFAPPVTGPAYPKAPGAGHRTDYAAELVDLVPLVSAAAGGNLTALGLLDFSQSRANRLAASQRLKDGAMLLPGVRAVVKRIPVTKV